MNERLLKLWGRPGLRQFIKFALVGGSGTIVNVAILYSLTEFAGFFYMVSAVAAFFVAMVNNFIWNKIWTFREPLSHRAGSKFVKFFVVSITALCVNLAFLYIFTEFFEIYYVISQVLAIGAALLVNFFGNRLWTFGNDTSLQQPY